MQGLARILFGQDKLLGKNRFNARVLFILVLVYYILLFRIHSQQQPFKIFKQ